MNKASLRAMRAKYFGGEKIVTQMVAAGEFSAGHTKYDQVFGQMAVEGGATVTATQCEFMENKHSGVICRGANTTTRLNDCKMHHNGLDGLKAGAQAVMDIHGTKTDIHANKLDGILAESHARVNIHLPSQHNTSHGNVGEDRNQEVMFSDGSGSGSIANINADGTFTHVVVDGNEDD